MKAIAFTPSSLFRLSQFSISKDWFTNYGLPEETGGLKRIAIGEILYLVDIALTTDNIPLIVINLNGEYPVFPRDADNVPALERITTVARSVYTTSVAVPTSWRPYHEGHLLSVSALPQGKGWRERLYFDTHPGDSSDLLVFARTPDTLDFSKLAVPIGLLQQARVALVDAVLSAPQTVAEHTLGGIVLSQRLPQGFVQGASLDEWYKSKLTIEQRSFVDKPYDGPVRLRGAAGTGKTLSLVIKFLRDGLRFEAGDRSVRLGFLTHSLASVDLVSAIAESLDKTGIMFGLGKRCTLELRTLYDLAHQHLHFDLANLTPLSLDGREGRRLQRELIEAVLREMDSSSILRLQYADLSSDMIARWKTVVQRTDSRFVAEIMSEFANVLDAEGIRAGEERGERYAKSTHKRPAWLMTLSSETDRRFILEVHRRYRKLLGDMNTLSVDQMVADFNSMLDSNRWDRTRNRDGYDALFVDELHLFTSVERQILHKLIKQATEEDGRPKRPPIFMAYDLKQSPHDTFTQYGEVDNNLFAPATGLQNSDLVKLNQVFRYTPQIAEFLTDLDATFPAIDIPGEWEAYAGKAKLADGHWPELTVFKDEQALFKHVFAEARKEARAAAGGGRRVAVLCPSDEVFDRYLKAAGGQHKDSVLPIDSRQPSSELRHAGKRFIFSMPEYVAGLQFDTVFLIHVDAKEAPRDASLGVRRRFISNVYLGSSRAEQMLRISACASRGGPSDVLEMALQRGSLRLSQI